MLNVKDKLKSIGVISIKLNVPQVGSFKIDYATLFDVDDDVLFDFVIDLKGDVIIGKGHYKLNKKQSQLYFAGRLKVKSGKISYIDNDSGHYIPTDFETKKVKEMFVENKIATFL